MLCIFPEGTRNGMQKGEKLHNGVTFLAVAGKVKVIPIGINGKFKLFHKVVVKIGKPIDLSEYYENKNLKDKYDEINMNVWNKIQNLLSNK